MGSGVHMDVDAAGVVDLGPRTPQCPHDLLDGGDVVIPADGGHQFHRVGPPDSSGPPSRFALDGGVAYDLPLPAFRIPDRIGVIVSAYMGGGGRKMAGDHPGSCGPGEAGHLDLNSKTLVLHSGSPSACVGGLGWDGFTGRRGRSLTLLLLSRYSRTGSGTDCS